MIVFTDRIAYADTAFTGRTEWMEVQPSSVAEEVRDLCERLITGGPLYRATVATSGCWQYAFLVEEASSSQYDAMIEISSQKPQLPNGILCLAGAGRGFHGQRGRPWAALPGNIHLTVFFSPARAIQKFHIGFSLLAAVSVIETIDSLDSLAGKAKIKWVNDVLIDGAKVAGFLANTSSSGDTVSAAVLGIGLNAETTPRIAGDAFMPKAVSLMDFIPKSSGCNQREILHRLLRGLDKNYRLLLAGRSNQLLDTYRKRSVIVGRRVKIISDASHGPGEELAAGRVLGIGENLELFLDGVKDPVTRGRLVLLD